MDIIADKENIILCYLSAFKNYSIHETVKLEVTVNVVKKWRLVK